VPSLVSLSAFPKSGVTYLSFLLFYSLFPDSCDIRDIEQKYILDIHAFPNATFADPTGPRLVKSHLPYIPTLPVVRSTSKAVYLIRHPIDVMASAWDFEALTSGGVRSTHSPAFRAFVRRWIETGAPMPEGPAPKLDGKAALTALEDRPITESERQFWSFRPLVRTTPPTACPRTSRWRQWSAVCS